MTNTQIDRAIEKFDEKYGACKAVDTTDMRFTFFELVKHIREILLAMKEPEDKTWKCPHCGKDEGTWFDRTLDDKGNMTTRCISCGKDIDENPIAPDGKHHCCGLSGCNIPYHVKDEDGICMGEREKCHCLTCDPKDVITIDRKVAEELVSWYPENCKNALQAIVDAVRIALNKGQQTTS
jgi:hypothetical protein